MSEWYQEKSQPQQNKIKAKKNMDKIIEWPPDNIFYKLTATAVDAATAAEAATVEWVQKLNGKSA